MTLKIVNLNILAFGLLLYFWRESYGLRVKNENGEFYDEQYYDKMDKKRTDVIVEYLKKYDGDVICLQEITDIKYYYLDSMTIQEYIAKQLGYKMANESFKQSRLNYYYPPGEQPYRNSPKKQSMDSGVAILVKDSNNLKHVRAIARAETFGPSTLFNSGIGSPFTVDELETKDHGIVYLINVHVRMQFPHIEKPIREIYNRIQSILTPVQLKKTITVGDFNAKTLESAKDLFNSDFHNNMFDVNASDLIEDHAFVGNDLRNYSHSIEYMKDMELLEMNVNKGIKTQWNKKDIVYNLSEKNNHLIDNNIVTTDHYPIIVTITSDKIKRVAYTLWGGMYQMYVQNKNRYLQIHQ